MGWTFETRCLSIMYSKSVAYSFSKDKSEDVWTKEWRCFWSQVVSWWVQWQHSGIVCLQLQKSLRCPTLEWVIHFWTNIGIKQESTDAPMSYHKSNTYGSKFQDHVMHNYAVKSNLVEPKSADTTCHWVPKKFWSPHFIGAEFWQQNSTPKGDLWLHSPTFWIVDSNLNSLHQRLWLVRGNYPKMDLNLV